MPIAKFINAKDILRLYNERNPDHHIGYHKARSIKNKIKKAYIEEHGEVYLHDQNLIPMSWFLKYYGESTFNPNKQKEKDA